MGLFSRKYSPKLTARVEELKPKVLISSFYGFGLPVSSQQYIIFYTEDKIVIDAGDVSFNLPLNKVINISREVLGDTQQVMMSNPGGAIAGAMIGGALGAAIGGAPSQHTVSNLRWYLIFTYQSGNQLKKIGFDVDRTPKSKEFVKLFAQRPNKLVVTIEKKEYDL